MTRRSPEGAFGASDVIPRSLTLSTPLVRTTELLSKDATIPGGERQTDHPPEPGPLDSPA